MSTWIAEYLRDHITDLPFSDFFNGSITLVPVPRSSLMKPHTVWPSLHLAKAIHGQGLALNVRQILRRKTSIRKSATQIDPGDRPKAQEHYETLTITPQLPIPEEILLVDDIVTRGATLLGAASRIAESYPDIPIRAFIAFRTISNASEFTDFYDSSLGGINLGPSGNTFRRP